MLGRCSRPKLHQMKQTTETIKWHFVTELRLHLKREAVERRRIGTSDPTQWNVWMIALNTVTGLMCFCFSKKEAELHAQLPGENTQMTWVSFSARKVPRIIGLFQSDLSSVETGWWQGLNKELDTGLICVWSQLAGIALSPCSMLGSAVEQGLRGHGWINPSCVLVLLP